MPSPNVQDVRQEVFLQGVLDAAMQPDTDFVHDRAFPTVNVQQISGIYHSVPRGQLTRTEARYRAYGVPAPLADFQLSRKRYVCETIELATPVFDDILAQCPNELDILSMATQGLGRKIKLKKEELWNAKFMQPGVWTGFSLNGIVSDVDVKNPDQNGGLANGQFDVAGSNPQLTLNFAQRVMKSRHGLTGKTLIMPEDVYAYLKTHAQIKDEIKYSQSTLVLQNSEVGKQIIAQALGVDEILVQSAVVEQGAEGQASNPGFIGGGNMLLIYKTPSPSIMTTSAGYCFNWTGDANATGGDQGRMRSWREEPTRCRKYEGATTFDFNIVASDCGVYFKNVLTTST